MDRAAFTNAVEQYQNMVYRVALHMLGTAQDAEDAVQEVFLRLYSRDRDFDGEEHLRRWLLRVTVNYGRDVLRSAWRRKIFPLDEAIPAPPFREESQEALYQAVMALPEKYRTVLDLFYYEDLSVREIASLLKLQPTAVTTRLNRARTKLKEQLGEEWQNE